MLSENRQDSEDYIYQFHLREMSKKSKSMGTERRLVATWDWEWEKELNANGNERPFESDGNVLKLVCGDNRAAL